MNLLQVEDLRTYIHAESSLVKAVDGVSFDIKKGEVFGIVGESGSGKTLTALSIVKLIPESANIESGSVLFNGRDILSMDEDALRDIRGAKISFVFQDPSSALNPVFTVGYQLAEAALTHMKEKRGAAEAKELALEYLKRARIKDPLKVFYDYPHQLSGGIKQRVGIAMALINSPELVILDEPTSALDVTIQAEILGLLEELIIKNNLSALFISHDFGVVSRMCHRVAVMNKGKFVEIGETRQVLNSPKDPYTMVLLDAVKALK